LAIKSELETSLDIISPQILKDNEAIDKLLELYFLNLRGQQEISEDPVILLDINYLIKKNDEGAKGVGYKDVKSELFKIHLDEIYKIFEDVQDNDKIYEKYKEVYSTLNIPTDSLKVDFNLDDEINDEYITASNSYKAKKGTKAGFFFINDIINKVNIDPLNSDPYFHIEEGLDGDLSVPYAYTVKASLYKEVFRETILPLSHPVGFNWHFFRLLYLTLVDYFGLIEIKTITDLVLTCYSLTNKEDISRQVLLKSSLDPSNVKTITSGEFGSVKNFYIAKDQEGREQVIIDFYSTRPCPSDNTKQNGYRLLRDYDGRVVIFERQDEILYTNQDGEEEIINLELEKIELVDKRQGELEVFKRKKIILGREVEVITDVRFKEYSIFNLSEVKMRYSFIGGTPLAQGEELTDQNRLWNYSLLELKNKVISSNKKFFENVDFSRKDIIRGSAEQFYGRVIKDRGMNCKLTYEIDYTYEVTTSDVSDYISNIRKAEALKQLNNPNYKDNDENTIQEFNQKETFDNWARLDPNNIGIKIGDLSALGKIGLFTIAGANSINPMDKGIDDFLGIDADIYSTYETKDYRGLPVKLDPGNVNDERVWRNEVYFKPSTYKDLSDLSKARVQSGHSTLEITATPAIYERENIGNETYTAHELKNIIPYIQMDRETTLEYNNFSNATGDIGEFIISDGSEIGGHIYSETGTFEVYQGVWNTYEKDSDNIEQINEEKRFEEPVNDYTQPVNESDGTTENVFAEEKHNTVQTHKETFDEYNLRNTDTLIGQGIVIGGTLDNSDEGQIFCVGGELVNIIDEDKVNTQILMGNNSNTELVVDSALYIGEGTIGNSYIKARLVTYTRRDEESYMNVGDFDIFSDEENWEMGVWKNDGDGNYILLEDNNVSAAS